MTRYDMALLTSKLGLRERFFLTRENGEQAYPLLKARLREVDEGQPLVLVFPPAQLMDSSFADETILRLGEAITAGEYEERCILLENLTTDSMDNIGAAISLRGLKLAFLAVEHSGAWQLVGRLEPSLQETLELVDERGHLTASELAELKELAINSASNRLRRLYDQRLVRRKHEISETGLQYIYYFWEWTEDQIDQGEGVEG
jgi:DNA-binding transcriptional ArsR family regulator